MNKPRTLLSDFATPSLDQWRQEVERLLKGAPFAKKMFTRTWEGIEVGPLYTAADTADIPWRDSLPGQAPFVRGTHAAGYHASPWLVAQELRCPICEDFNQALRHALKRGQTAVNLIFDLAGRQGQDPDQVAPEVVGCGGTSVSSLADLSVALDGVDLSQYPIFIQSGAAPLPAAAMLLALVRRRQGEVSQLRGCLGSDPFAGLAIQGCVHTTVEEIHDELAILTRWVGDHAPGLRTLPVFESPWHEGGADLALSLGLTLSAAVAKLRALEARGIEPEMAAPRFQFNLEIGTDFFMELAKLRALRLLWSRILTASGVAPKNTGTFVHARTAQRSLTVLDPHVNLLRTTTEAMSAVLGGTDSLHVSSFDEAARMPDEFSRRIARNVQLILAHECHLDQVTDPAGGSWYVESLTRDLAKAAWAKFQAAEQAGGMPAVLVSGWAQEQVATAAAARAAGYASRRHVLVGTNMYPAAENAPQKESSRDCSALHRGRAEALSRQRTSVTQEAHMLVLTRLEKLTDCPAEELLDRMVDAAGVGATIGEFQGVMRGDDALTTVANPIPPRRDAAPFESLRARTQAMLERRPAAARVFMACLGDFARYMPRLEFARGFFQVGGFQIAGDEFHIAPEAAVAAARADGAATVVLVGLDTTYAEWAAEVARSLSDGGAAPTVILAGAPGENEDDLRKAGVGEFVHLRCDTMAVLNTLLENLEGQS